MGKEIHVPETATPPRLTICGLQELCSFKDAAVTHVLSILDPSYPEPEDFSGYAPHKRLTLRFDDILDPTPGLLAPQREHVERLLEFGEGLIGANGSLCHLLVHCHAGISRSSASMATLLAEAQPTLDEDSVFARLREIRPQAWPNSLMIGFADDLLGRGGRFVAALRRHYGIQMRARPDLAQLIERVGRQKEVLMAA
jgi:predicted protein tyrosine phosphatase